MRKHAKTRGVWGHAPPGKFCNLQARRLLLVASETSLMASIRLHFITRILGSFVNLRFRNVADLSFDLCDDFYHSINTINDHYQTKC